MFKLTSNSFEHTKPIPPAYTCDGADISPELHWNDPPQNARSFALICDDPDAPSGTWVHWVLYGLSHDASELPEALTNDAEVGHPRCKQGMNDFRRVGYGGPCPPRGHAHRYFFKLYALDQELDLPPKKTKTDLLNAMRGHILAETELMGTYQRKS